LSQSSKTIHFGIGPDEEIERLTVRWPGVDAPQTWTGLSPNERYRLTLGQADAQPMEARTATLPLRPNDADDVEPEETTARLWFSEPPAVTPQPYQRFDGQTVRLEAGGRHRLVAFWASWCPPCLTELHELNERHTSLQDAGLEILALSVEGLDERPETDADAAREMAARLQWKFPVGWASRELIEHLNALRHAAIYREDRLPIPASFLIDRRGRLRAVYAGPVNAQQLEEDVRALDSLDEAENRARSIPFAGRWCEELFITHPVAIAAIYREEYQFEDAREFLQRHLKAEPAPAADDRSPEAAAVRRRLADVHHALGVIAVDTQEPLHAIEEFETAIEFYPRHVDALLDLGERLVEAGRLDDARRRLQAADGLNPRDPRPANQLGLLELKADRAAEAMRQFERSLAISSRYFPAANNLAWLLATNRDDRLRDGARAVRLVEEMVARVGARPDLLDTLAAAYAEAGDFARAVDAAELAVDHAERDGRSELAAQISARLAIYQSGQAYRAQ
jgi:tetratricopeptide (TPR) repeat protein